MKSYDKKRHQEQAPKIRLQKKINRKIYNLKNQIQLWNYFIENPCIDCNQSNPLLLSFDHIKGNKSYNISERMGSQPWKTILKEIKKCVVRCYYCHHLKTAKDRNYWTLQYFDNYGLRQITEKEIEEAIDDFKNELQPLVEELKSLDGDFFKFTTSTDRFDEVLKTKLILDSKPDKRAGTVLKTDGT